MPDREIVRLLRVLHTHLHGSSVFDTQGFMELLAQFATEAPDGEGSALRAAFERLDEDGDGFVTEQDICRLLALVGEQPTKEEMALILKDTELGPRGLISYAQFRAFFS